MNRKKRPSLRITWKTLVAVPIVVLHVLPLYITIAAALKPVTDMSSYWLIPAAPAWGNFEQAMVAGDLFRAFLNTIVITVCSTFLVVLLGAMAGYPLARAVSRLNSFVRNFILSILMVPALSLLVPLYVMLVQVRGVSTFWGIIPMHVAFNVPLSVFLYANFIRAIPRELDEAALIDGSSVYAVFYRIILPLLKPVTVTVVILTMVAVWNDFQYSLYFLQKPDMRVVTLAIANFFGISGADPHVAAAAALLSILPVTIVFVFLQKYFVRGTVESAFK